MQCYDVWQCVYPSIARSTTKILPGYVARSTTKILPGMYDNDLPPQNSPALPPQAGRTGRITGNARMNGRYLHILNLGSRQRNTTRTRAPRAHANDIHSRGLNQNYVGCGYRIIPGTRGSGRFYLEKQRYQIPGTLPYSSK